MHELDLLLQYQFVGKNKEAREVSDKMENLGPNVLLDNFGENTTDVWFRHRYNRGWFLLQEGNYQEGSKLLDSGRFLSVYGAPPLQTNIPIFNPQEHNILDKTIVINLEGGFGDEIIHIRFAKSYKNMGAKEVIILCSTGLKELFSRVEGVDRVIPRNEFKNVEFDYWVPGFSAGWIAGHTFDNLLNETYIFPEKKYLNKWKNIIVSDKLKVGIRWAGNPKFEHQQFRKFPVEFITNLTNYEELKLYSFQKDYDTINLPDDVIDLEDQLETWDDTVAALKQLDILITSCTSLAHLAGAMGIKTWVVVPILPYHTWAWKCPESTTTPYYQNTKIFRQTEYRKWNHVWQKLYSELEEEYDLVKNNLPNCDREQKKINLGCGLEKFVNYLNVDSRTIFEPDQLVDLNSKTWPWKDNEFSHISAKNILQYLDNPENAIKEMYRISENGALWEIKVPDINCVISDSDIQTKRKFPIEYFMNFDQRVLMDEKIVKGEIDNLFAYEEKIDVQILDVSIQYSEHVELLLKEEKIKLSDIVTKQQGLNNIKKYVTLLMQVFKEPRYFDSEFETGIKKIIDKKGLVENINVGINKLLK